MKRGRATYRTTSENPHLLLTGILAVGGGAVLVWGIYARQWLPFVKYFVNALIEGCIDVFALLAGYPPVLYLLVLSLLLGTGLLYAGRQATRKLVVSRLIGGAGRDLMQATSRRNSKLRRVLERIKMHYNGPLPVYLVKSAHPICLVQGLIEPRIIVSSAVCRELSEDELEAAVLHEVYHLQRRDPLRRLAAESVADFLFFIPVLRNLVRRLLDAQELAADRFTAGLLGTPNNLASAIVKIASGVSQGFGSPLGQGSVTHRVKRLLGLPHGGKRRTGMIPILVSVIFAAIIFAGPFIGGVQAAEAKKLGTCTSACSYLSRQVKVEICVGTCAHKK